MAKGTKIRLEMDSAHKILSKRKLGKGGEAQKMLLTELRAKTAEKSDQIWKSILKNDDESNGL